MYSNRIAFRNCALLALALAAVCSTGAAYAVKHTPPPNPCDINGADGVNAIDVQLCINAALSIDISPFDGDVNGDDGIVDANIAVFIQE